MYSYISRKRDVCWDFNLSAFTKLVESRERYIAALSFYIYKTIYGCALMTFIQSGGRAGAVEVEASTTTVKPCFCGSVMSVLDQLSGRTHFVLRNIFT